MLEKFLLSIDQGTTGTKVVLFDQQGEVRASSYKKHTQYYTKPGWTEHDPEEIWACIGQGIQEALAEGKIEPSQIEAIGLANQGETVLFWDDQGRPLYPAIVWSCRRSQAIAREWEAQEGWSAKVFHKTGLRIDPYFSATKIRWMMEEVEQVQGHIRDGSARCSTLDSWLIWKMTGGRSFVTDPSTAARTMLYNTRLGEWDQEILEYLEIDAAWLPSILPTAGHFGITSKDALCGIEAPIRVSIVDQPAALYGHLCTEPGTSKCTYGTGCFVYMNIGSELPDQPTASLLSTIVWSKDDNVTYALDGAIYSAGSTVDWAMNELALFSSIDELQAWSTEWYHRLLNAGGEYDRDANLWFAPCLSGAGAPYWNSDFRGLFLGLSHGTSKKEMAKAVLEGIAHRVADVIDEMQQVSMHPVTVLRVDGGLTANAYLMQYQADLLGIPVEVPGSAETTALGTAYLTGEACGWWTTKQLRRKVPITHTFHPRLDAADREALRGEWARIMQLMTRFYSKG
ncbi:FGGY family carbohydrate kinase [Paenibacillus mendelii]|uniref:ATP:glycerol 3-phosphotransferase n=1 Tax=Paenibacillus mendelii TaxID=206163 RepID=A0ABV6JMA6_9BACL|nr:glycerol kinase [Paenibacillus mendelii]MCQ6562329.1 glycerol kinase GlpK [Paenibacillus mendelii]